MKRVVLLVIVLGLLAGCTSQPAQEKTLTVMTHDSFAVSEDLVTQFEEENGVKLVFLKSGDTGSALNRAILMKNSPEADVFYGVDNTFLSRALDEDLFLSYDAPALQEIPDEFQLDAEKRALPVDYGDVCINYDKAYFASHDLALPQSLDDLLKPVYGQGTGKEGMLVAENPAVSSTGLAFLLATIAEYGEDGYLDYWQALKENGLVVVNDWSTAYYTNFSGSSGKGAQPMAVSYASSPAVEVVYASEPLDDAPTASLVGQGMCFRQIEFVGILKSTKNEKLAKKFVDFMLDKDFQEDMPLQMYVYPVNPQAQLPEVFVKYNQVPDSVSSLDPALIAEKREAWLQAWTDVVLK